MNKYNEITKCFEVVKVKDAEYDDIIRSMEKKCEKYLNNCKVAIKNAKTKEELIKIYDDLLIGRDPELINISDQFLKISNEFSKAMLQTRNKFLNNVNGLTREALKKIQRFNNEE